MEPNEKKDAPASGEKANAEQRQDERRVPSISLPKGGGALRPIDEKFSVNGANGTCELTVSLPFSTTRSGLDGAVALRYSSGGGNGPFGMGWSLSLPSIQRATDSAIPRYEDDRESDDFVLAGAENLVPAFTLAGGAWERDEVTSGTTHVTRYRPRVEGLFSRVEKITLDGEPGFFWKATSRENVVTIFGRTAAARVADPEHAAHIFRWLPEWMYDDKGNCVEFVYKPEDLGDVPLALEEKSRREGTQPFTNRYLKSIRYGNTQPYVPSQPFTPAPPAAPGYWFETIFDYGEHEDAPAEARGWPCRFDPFSDCRAGFEIRTYRLCRRVLFFHHIAELDAQPYLVRSIDLDYRHFDFGASPHVSREADFITRVRRVHYRKNGGVYARKELPPLSLTWQEPEWDDRVLTIHGDELAESPAQFQWLDLYGDGAPGMLTEQGGAWYFKRNGGEGRFGAALAVAPKPSLNGIADGSLQLQDLDGDGRKQVVAGMAGVHGYFELSDANEWLPFRAFEQVANGASGDPNAKFLDLDGDGKADLLLTEDLAFRWHRSLGTRGFDEPRFASRALDEERGPAVVFSDRDQSIFVADMNGDGLADIVRIRNGEIAYWPNLGYGHFGAKVSMRNAPHFDLPERFQASRVQLADVTGTGAADLVYTGDGGFTTWMNLSGNAFGEAVRIEPFPGTEPPNRVSVIDLLGNGTAAIVWQSDLPAHRTAPIRYVDPMGGRKPYVLSSFENGLGKRVELEYRPSTYYARLDRRDGKPWATKLPFPVTCTSRVVIRDSVTGSSYAQEWRYRHGYYDHAEREFRGFGMVEQSDVETFDRYTAGGANTLVDTTLQQPPRRTRTWYHTGAYVRGARILDLFAADYFQSPIAEHRPPGEIESDAPLTQAEAREAARACKGIVLRQEIYADDDSLAAGVPYTVVAHGRCVRMMQPLLGNRHAVFLSYPTEAITYHYERDVAAPRIAHELNAAVDELGNVLESASVVYPRPVADAALPAEIQAEQLRMRIAYTVRQYTNDVLTNAAHRRRQLGRTQRFELTGAGLTGDVFTRSAIRDAFAGASMTAKRLLRDDRVLFASDADPETPLPPLVLESRGLPYESYRLALTPSLRTALYDARVSDAMLLEGAYVQEPAGTWWVPSGTSRYPANPADHFFLPDRFVDPFGGTTTVQYHGTSHLLVERVEDAGGNVTTVLAYDFRMLQPQSVRDLNDNIAEVRFDIAGIVVGRAERGKGSEADDFAGFDPDPSQAAIDAFLADPVANGAALLQNATARYVYDVAALPATLATITRETHHQAALAAGTPSKLQFSFEYSDGLARVAMRKVQAEPGPAKLCTVAPDGTYTIVEIDTTPERRWVGSGRTIYNNKGKRVMEYEPYFSATHGYETAAELVETGFTPLVRYDPMDRVIRTDFPDGTFSRTAFSPWRSEVWDGNDNVLASEWYAARIGGAMGPVEQSGAQKTALHDGTPTVEHFDPLGHSIYAISHNRFVDRLTALVRDERYAIHTVLDIDGNRLRVRDARGNDVMRYAYDLHGRAAITAGMDGGERRALMDAAGQPLYGWDAKGNRFHSTYDVLRRPIAREVLRADATTSVYELLRYGTDKARNERGQLVARHDGSGVIENALFDFKHNVLETSRRFAADGTVRCDWTTPAAVAMQPRTFTTVNVYDALNRIVSTTTPDGSIASPSYSEAGSVTAVRISVRGAAPQTYVDGIRHDAKGQRVRVAHANGAVTETTYDDRTRHVRRIRTTRASDNAVLQDLQYAYDPSGNVLSVRDLAQQTVYFNNAVVEPHNDFVYDAVYRLVTATGREAIGLNEAPSPFDGTRTSIVHRADGSAVQRYRQEYEYDPAGNMTVMAHASGAGPFVNRWTRRFTVEAASNRLASSEVGPDVETFAYDEHGNVTSIRPLASIEWDFRDRLHHAGLGGGGTAHYAYDADGMRTRKVIVRPGGLVEERFYAGSVEVFTRTIGGVVDVERETLHIMDGPRRVATVETRVAGSDPGPEQLFRYVFSNQLGTAALELDEAAQVISYEEYHPFGSTSFQSVAAGREVPAKRYRYSGKERDEESGFYDHGARYYAPWLARWTAADPKGIESGTNLYAFVLNNPIKFFDPDGRDVRISVDQQTHTITYSTTVHIFATQAEITRLTPMAQRATQFFANPTIETGAETEARFLRPSGARAPAPRQPVFTDVGGTRWTVRYDVQYRFHDTATTTSPHTAATVRADPTGFVTNRAANERAMTQAFGYAPGDNVLTISPPAGTTGGIASFIHTPDATMPNYGRPESRMFTQLMTNPNDAIMQESLIHETGHVLGFEDRYRGPALGSAHAGFQFDFMTVAAGRSEITMHPIHIAEAARFGIGIADGRNLTNQVLRGPQLDDTGPNGSVPAFRQTNPSAPLVTNPAYQPLQNQVANELIPFYRGTVNGPVPPPPPPPPPPPRHRRFHEPLP